MDKQNYEAWKWHIFKFYFQNNSYLTFLNDTDNEGSYKKIGHSCELETNILAPPSPKKRKKEKKKKEIGTPKNYILMFILHVRPPTINVLCVLCVITFLTIYHLPLGKFNFGQFW